MDAPINTAVYGTEVIHIDEPEKNWEICNHLESHWTTTYPKIS